MATVAEELAAYTTPPRASLVWAVTLDTTFRAYNLIPLAMGGFTPEADGKRRGEVFVTIQAQTADVFFYFSATDTAASANSTTAQSAASADAAYGANTMTAYIPAGQERSYVLNRSLDKYLIVKGSAAGILRMFASSPAAT